MKHNKTFGTKSITSSKDVNYDVINLPTKKLHDAIRKNLATAQSLIYVFQFNQPCWEQELRLGSGDQDWEQWQVSFKQNVLESENVQLARQMNV